VVKAAVVVLAAGGSTRLGRPKQLLPYRGTTLLAHAAGTALAARIGPVLVVLGADADQMPGALAGLDVHTVVNAAWRSGMAASVCTGLAAVEQRWPGTLAVVLATCDQPLIQPKTLRALAVHVTGGATIAACGYGGAVGVPAAFARTRFGELLALRGEEGARRILLTHATEIAVVDCPEAAVDVDTEADARGLDRFGVRNDGDS